jgi:hypothetical protein
MNRALVNGGLHAVAISLLILPAARGAELSTKSAQPASLTDSAKSPSGAADQVAYINEQIRAGWQAHSLQPLAPATDGEWCRRIYLDILGRIPTIDELERFERDHSSVKRQSLVNRILSDEYVEEYAQNWSHIWTTILIGRPPAMPDRKSLVDREGMEKYLRDSFARNKPYDQMVHELLTTDGVNKPGEEGFHGEVNFLIGNMDDDNKGVNATAKTAKIFLGLQVQCTQCHNHPFNEWQQNQFWQLNAFFRQTKAIREAPKRTPEPLAKLVSQTFNGENSKLDQAMLFYDQRNGVEKAALPVFVDGTEISPDGRLSVVNRREELAKLITSSKYIDQAIVNRMWGHFLGYGFTKPVDDMGPHNPPSHPELLAKLADDFSMHSRDLKQLIRWIVLSEPYGLSSKMRRPPSKSSSSGQYEDDPSKGEKPMFSHFYLRQMRPEELYDSLLVASDVDKTMRSSEEQEKLRTQWLSQFTITFGTDDGEDTTTFNGTIPQTLMMFNGELMRRATGTEAGGFLEKIGKDQKTSNKDKINRLFLATLSRKPTTNEIEAANKLLVARKGDPVGALQDVLWVTLNTGEFILNH